MGPPSFMRSVVDRNVVTWHIPLYMPTLPLPWLKDSGILEVNMHFVYM